MAQITVNEAVGDFTHYIKLDYVDLKAIGTGNTKNLLTLPAGSAVDLVGIVLTTAIAGATAVVIDVGYSGTAGAFISQWNANNATVNGAVFNTGSDFALAPGASYSQSTASTVKGGSLPVKAVSSATNVLFKVTDSSLASITAGQVIVGLRVINLARFA